VVTVHNAPPVGGGVAALVYKLLERLVARGADLVLCVSPDLEARARAAGARRVERAVVPAPVPDAAEAAAAMAATAAEAVAAARERPVVLAAGRLTAQKGFGTLLAAASSWQDLKPKPLLLIAGAGPLAGELRARATALGVDVTFLGQRDDVPALLAAAAVFVLPSRWEGQPLVLQEALRAGSAIVAARVGGIPALTGEDAALLIPPDDPARLAAAVREVLTDSSVASRLRAAAAQRAATLPSESDAVAAALAAYDALAAARLCDT
jgi:glycosyltransferase involved in cell wall biosynthesis